MRKIYVVDTNVFLQDPYAIFAFEDNDVVIPAVVLEEMDSKKHALDQAGKNARVFSNLLDKLRTEQPIYEGVRLHNGGTLRIELVEHSYVDNFFIENTIDNRIISVAHKLKEIESKSENPRPVILVSNDTLVRVKADVFNIPAERYKSDQVIDTEDNLYKGFKEINLDPRKIDDFYSNGTLDLNELKEQESVFYPNEFVLLKDLYGGSSSAIGIVSNKEKEKLMKLVHKEPIAWGIAPKNIQQRMALDVLLREDIPLVTMIGKAGTGKTLLAIAAGLSKVEEGSYKKLLVTRPVVPLGRDIGYLPGEKEEKLRPWMQPIYDNLEFLFQTKHDGELDGILSGLNWIEVEALSYVRGRSIPGQFIIIDEAQNLTKHEVKTIVTRVGEGSKIVLMGDPEQIDHPYLDKYNNGLTYIVEKFKNEVLSAHVTLVKGERSALAQRAADIL